MGISLCGAGDVDETCRENISHGDIEFPVAIYRDILEKDEVPWHWHIEMELIYVLDGEGYFTCNGRKYRLSAGKGFFINSGNLHGCEITEKGHCILKSIVFHHKFVAGGIDSVLWRKYIYPLAENHEFDCMILEKDNMWMERILQDILDCWDAASKEENGYEFEIREKLSAILFLLYKNMSFVENGGTNKIIRSSNRMKLMMDFVLKNYASDIKIKDVAASAMISESECLRSFKNFLGMTASMYVKSIRLQKAVEYLTGTDLPVCRIAELCGYSDGSYFGKQFKEEKGITPLEYRMNQRGRL